MSQSEEEETYDKRQGTNNLSKNYMNLMRVFSALKLCFSDDIDDFKMTAHIAEYGKFGNLSLEVTFSDQSTRILLLHLKYKENISKELTNQHLKLSKGDFSLLQAVKNCGKMKDKKETCIVFTNIVYSSSEDSFRISEGKLTFEVRSSDYSSSEEYLLLNTSKSSFCHKFVLDEDKHEFIFFTSQATVGELESLIREELLKVSIGNIYDSFAYFMEQWSMKKYILTKHDIIAKLTELALDTSIQTLSSAKSNEKTELLKEAIMNSQLTIVQNEEDIITKIWRKIPEENEIDKDMVLAIQKYVVSSSDKFSPKQVNVALWYLDEVPIIVKINKSNRSVCKNALKLIEKKMGKKRIVVLGEEITEELKFQGKIFRVLSDLSDFDHIIKNYTVSLQKRHDISLEMLIKSDEAIVKCVTVSDLLKMSQNEYFVGEKIKEELPLTYIPRRVSIIYLNTNEIIKKCLSEENCLIISYLEEFEESLHNSLKNVTAIEVSHYLNEKSMESNLILLANTGKRNFNDFNRVCQKCHCQKRKVHLIQVIDDSNCILLMTKGSFFAVTKSEKKIIDNDLFGYFHTSLITFVAPPGEGKSTFLTYLSEKCPSKFWSSYVKLIDHIYLFKKKINSETILCHFLGLENEEGLTSEVRKILKKESRIYLFLDGLDEIDSDCVDNFFIFVNEMILEGVKIWFTSRENLQGRILEELGVVPITIEPIYRNQQIAYIRRRLELNFGKSCHQDEKIEKLISALYVNVDSIIREDILSNPLHLSILAEALIDNIDKASLFPLTKIFELLLEGKIKVPLQSTNISDLGHQLGHDYKIFLKNYEVPALKSVLDDDDFKKLDLNYNQSFTFLSKLMLEGDKFGIIQTVREDNRPEFVFHSFATYFACLWFKDNLAKVSRIREELFSKYHNLRIFLDVILASENPLHLSIIYGDRELFKKYVSCLRRKKKKRSRDQGGRSGLHLLCCYGFTILDTESADEMIELLLLHCHIDEKDTIFQFDCVDYAIRSQCVYPIQKFLKDEGTPLNFVV